MIDNIIGGAVSAAFYGWTAYKKQKATTEQFEWKRLAPVVILGGVIGGVAGYSGIDYNMVIDASWTGYAAIIIENAWKWVYRNVLKKK